MTTPSTAQIPRAVRPFATALSAYSICRSFPVRENVVSEKLYAESPILRFVWSQSSRNPFPPPLASAKQ
jgi:hypothetical protein